MSQTQADNFLSKVQADKKLFNLLKSMPDMEAQYALANQLGFNFTREELQAALQIKIDNNAVMSQVKIA